MSIWFSLPLRISMQVADKVSQTWLLMLKDQPLRFDSPGLADPSHSCFQAVLHVCVLERQAKSEKTEYLLDTPEASIGASSPTGTFLSCSFLVINHLQMLPQQHSCGRLSTSVWIPCLSVTKVRKKAALKSWLIPQKQEHLLMWQTWKARLAICLWEAAAMLSIHLETRDWAR